MDRNKLRLIAGIPVRHEPAVHIKERAEKRRILLEGHHMRLDSYYIVSNPITQHATLGDVLSHANTDELVRYVFNMGEDSRRHNLRIYPHHRRQLAEEDAKARVGQGKTTDEFVIVTDPTAESTLADILYKTNTKGLVNFILGVGTPQKLKEDNFTIYPIEAETQATADAQDRLTRKGKRPLTEEGPEIVGGKPAPDYATKTDKNVIKAHMDGVRKAIDQIRDAIHTLAQIPKTSSNHIQAHVDKLNDVIGDDNSGLHELLKVYYDDYSTFAAVRETYPDPITDRNPDVADPAKITGYMRMMSNAEEEEQTPDKPSRVDVGTEVKTNEDDKEYIVLDLNPSEHPDKLQVKSSVHNTIHFINKDPSTFTIIKETDGYYYDQNLQSWGDVNKPVNVGGDKEVNYAPGEDKNEIPHQHLDGDKETEDKVKVPAGVLKQLRDGIATFKEQAERVEGRDQETARFYRTCENAFTQLLDWLSDPTIMHVKRAQVYLTSLMGPILHKIPRDVVQFLADGGQRRSLTKYFQEVKAKGN